MKFNKKHGLPGYGNIGNSGNTGKIGLSTYYTNYNLNNLDELKIFYSTIYNSSTNYNKYDYVIDNKTFVYFINDILNTNGNNIPTPIFSFNLNNFYNYYLGNRIYSNYYVDNVYTNDYYVNGSYINYNNYVYNKNLNHVTYTNYLTPGNIIGYNLYLNKNFNAYYINYTGYNLISSNMLVFDNLALSYNSKKDMSKNLNSNYYPLISLCDMPIKNLLLSNFNITENNNIDISTCITNISLVDNNINLDWNVENIFKSFDNSLINDYKFNLLIYSDPKSILTTNNIEYDADNNRLTCNNQYFTYKSKSFILKDYNDNNLSGHLEILNDYFDSSLIDDNINYKFVLQIYSRYEKNLNNYIEYGIYSNSIIKNKLSPDTYYINIDNKELNISPNKYTFSLNVTTNIPYNDGEIGIDVINNNYWISIDSIEKKTVTDYTVVISCESNVDNIEFNDTSNRTGSLQFISKNNVFNNYSTNLIINQEGYSYQIHKLDFELYDSYGVNSYLKSDPNLGLYCDMFTKYISIPIYNGYNDQWINLNAKYIELDIDLIIEFYKYNNFNNYGLDDLKNNSFRIGVQYIGKNKAHNNCIDSSYDFVYDNNEYYDVQDLFNSNGIAKYIKDGYDKYLNVLNDASYTYSSSKFQYFKYKWINFDKNRNNDNTSIDSVVTINDDYFSTYAQNVFLCRLESTDVDNNDKNGVIRKKILIPIEDALTENEQNDVIQLTDGQQYKKYIDYSPKIRIFVQYENPSISSIQISYKRNGIKLLDAEMNELNNSYSKNTYNDITTKCKQIDIVDWHPVLTGNTFNNALYPYISLRSNYIENINSLDLDDYLSNDYRICVENIRPSYLPNDYLKYNYIVGKLPNAISNTSFVKYGFNNRSSSQYALIEGTQVLSSKYKQVSNNYPIFGRLNYTVIYNNIKNGNNAQILNVPNGLNNNYIPDSIYLSWYNQLSFATWSVINVHTNDRFLTNHEMTTNRNIDIIYNEDPSVLTMLPELSAGLFMNNLYNLGTPNGKNIAYQVTKYACPYNLFFKFSVLNYNGEKVNDNIIETSTNYYVNLIGRPQVGTYTKSATYVFLGADKGQNYILNSPLANYNAANNNFWQTYNIPDR